MLKIYGSMLCPDCVQCREDLDKTGIEYDYLDFSDSLMNLKEFLVLRDNNAVFSDVRRDGRIGIPCLVDEDGNVSLSWDEYVSQG